MTGVRWDMVGIVLVVLMCLAIWLHWIRGHEFVTGWHVAAAEVLAVAVWVWRHVRVVIE